MSDILCHALITALTSHGLVARRIASCVETQHGLTFVPSVGIHPSSSNSVLAQVVITVSSPIMGNRKLTDAFAGVGPTQEAAERNAFGKFLLGSFHVLIEAFTEHQCESNQVEWLQWKKSDYEWRICSGPALSHSNSGAKNNALYGQALEKLKEVFIASAAPGLHWVSAFLAFNQTPLQACEVAIDNQPWPDARNALASFAWNSSTSYETLRHFFICLPASDKGNR